jgi:Uma2 family endonuclease
MAARSGHALDVERVWDSFPAKVRFARPLDDQELWDFCEANPLLRVEREPNGDIVIMSPVKVRTSKRHVFVLQQLANWADRDGTGAVLDAAAAFKLPDTAIRGPDASWSRNERLDGVSDDEPNFPSFVPDFVVEVMSPGDRIKAAERKMQQYLDNGVRLGWLIDPKRATFAIYRPGQSPERLVKPATVSADPELPGFVLDLSRIW